MQWKQANVEGRMVGKRRMKRRRVYSAVLALCGVDVESEPGAVGS